MDIYPYETEEEQPIATIDLTENELIVILASLNANPTNPVCEWVYKAAGLEPSTTERLIEDISTNLQEFLRQMGSKLNKVMR